MSSSVTDAGRRGARGRVADALSRRMARWHFVIGGAVAAGIALRVGILASRLGTVDADEAVGGLMVNELLDGHPRVFFWLSYYAGTQEILLTAPIFALLGASVVALKLVPVVLFAAAAVVTWRVGIRIIGEPAARIAGALMWIWPPFFVFWTTKRSSYPTALLCSVLFVLLALRLYERPTRRDALALGAVAGCGIWSTPQTLFVFAPVLVWLVIRRSEVLRRAGDGAVGFLVGGAPWLLWNATHGFKALLPVDAVAGADSTYVERFRDLFAIVLPEWLGLRLPYSQAWLVPPWLGTIVTLAAVVGAFVAARRLGRRGEPLLVVLVTFPFLYAASSFTYFTDEPRYLTFLAPVGALLLAGALRSPAAAALGLGVAFVLSLTYLARLEESGRYPFLGQPRDIQPLIRMLDREREDRVFASYWLAYRLVFESDERIVATSTGFVRNAEWDRAVKRDPSAAYAFVAGSPPDRAARQRLREYRRLTSGGWTAYVRR